MQGYGGFTSSYSGLFGKRINQSEQDGEQVDKTEQDKHLEYWGWYVTLDSLSNKDRTKWDYYLNMNVVAFLNYLSFVKDRNKWQS